MPSPASPPVQPKPAGFNWPNATRVYVNHWDQGNVATETTYANRAVPWTVAAAHGVQVVRVFTWDESTINTYNGNPSQALADLTSMCDDAWAQGVQLILTPLLDRASIERLNNSTPYASDLLAQQAMLTSGSTPWNAFEALTQAAVAAVGAHPGVYSWEAVNEPGYELGPDAGTTTAATMAAFLGHFHTVLRNAGARRITLGAWPHYDPNNFYSDPQIVTMYSDAYSVDAHFYPASSTDPAADAAAADVKVAALESVLARVRTALGRPAMPAQISECGSTPTVWFERLMSQAVGRGWLTVAWGYSIYDEWAFDDDTEPQVLDFIATMNAPKGSFLGMF